jgi:hypothetical protein
MTLPKTLTAAVETLRSAGALEAPVDWRALKVNGNALKGLIERGIVLPPEGESFSWRRGYCYGNGPVPTRTVRLDPGKVAALSAAPAPAPKPTGTCPCCFRSMALKGGKVVRHGWKEIGGGYGRGRGWHSGSCFGARGFEPFEVSNRGTLEFVAVLRTYLPEAEAELARLVARPQRIRFTYRGVDPVTRRYTDLVSELEDDGGSLDALSPYMSGRSKSYAYQLSLLINAQQRELSALRSDIQTLSEKAESWTKKEVAK